MQYYWSVLCLEPQLLAPNSFQRNCDSASLGGLLRPMKSFVWEGDSDVVKLKTTLLAAEKMNVVPLAINKAGEDFFHQEYMIAETIAHKDTFILSNGLLMLEAARKDPHISEILSPPNPLQYTGMFKDTPTYSLQIPGPHDPEMAGCYVVLHQLPNGISIAIHFPTYHQMYLDKKTGNQCLPGKDLNWAHGQNPIQQPDL